MVSSESSVECYRSQTGFRQWQQNWRLQDQKETELDKGIERKHEKVVLCLRVDLNYSKCNIFWKVVSTVRYTSKVKLSQEESGNIKNTTGLSKPLAHKKHSAVYSAPDPAWFLSINPSLASSNHDKDFHIAAAAALMWSRCILCWICSIGTGSLHITQKLN